ncbi:glycine oxidase ThiO [Vampirovibrio sp.]|uniref:glycine oxidase ThiO n=1 Tax=Vampirovibrio sp. TaxID=2717857 RepID=UPI003594010F
MSQSVGIVGAGLMGRLLALALAERGWQVSLFDKDDASVINSCAYAGAGMLSPISELESAEPLIARLGFDSLPRWKHRLQHLELPVYFKTLGTIIVAHHLDLPDLAHFKRMLQGKLSLCSSEDVPEQTAHSIQWHLSSHQLAALEPQLSQRFSQGIFIPDEGQIDNRQLLRALAHQLNQSGVNCYFKTPVTSMAAHTVISATQHWQFDWAIDCRGLGGKPDWQSLRGVRGEIIKVHAPEVELSRPIRLMHPRYPLYIAPRENHQYVIGATSIESEDFRPITTQSTMELLSAAFAVHEGFAEATILESTVNCRPALSSHLPAIHMEAGLIRVNGLYRHGFLISPQLVALVCAALENQAIAPAYQALFSQPDFKKTESESTSETITINTPFHPFNREATTV